MRLTVEEKWLKDTACGHWMTWDDGDGCAGYFVSSSTRRKFSQDITQVDRTSGWWTAYGLTSNGELILIDEDEL